MTDTHRLRLKRLDLVGGRRTVEFAPGLNCITGPISSGKSTLIRLISVALSATPSALPPETAVIRGLDIAYDLQSSPWRAYRPLVSTADARVEIALQTADDEGEALGLAATGFQGSYGSFLLEHLGLPVVAIPEGTSSGKPRLNTVSMSDWLSYCIILGDDLDSDVFGHDQPFKDTKRKYIFQLIYGLHDPELAEVTAAIRAVQLQLDALEYEEIAITNVLAGTPIESGVVLQSQIATRRNELAHVDAEEARAQARSSDGDNDLTRLRNSVLTTQKALADEQARAAALEQQVRDLEELEKQLRSQSARLTRAIVADEWLVDFEFLVCPRCGTDVTPIPGDDHCYLCHQIPTVSAERETASIEQARVISQVEETADLITSRSEHAQEAARRVDAARSDLARLESDLNRATRRYVSAQANDLQSRAARRARLEAEITQLEMFDQIFSRRESRAQRRMTLEAERDRLHGRERQLRIISAAADANIDALETRMLDYLQRLHVPVVTDLLTATINRRTYLPEVSGRTFAELSSQGLKTLVNIAHALAHHTVAIDRNLPLPGLLVLDGLSANVGYEGFDQARINDLYTLLVEESEQYRDDLQLVIVDNTLPADFPHANEATVVLRLSDEERLVRPVKAPGDGSAEDVGSATDNAAEPSA